MKFILRKNSILYITLFVILFLSFAFNLFNIIKESDYRGFDHFSESLVIGKLARAEHEGIFAHGGFPGFNYKTSDVKIVEIPPELLGRVDSVVFHRNQVMEPLLENPNGRVYNYYFEDVALPDGYYTYTSQIGGQSYFYTLLDKVSPFSNETNYYIFKSLNALLMALCMMFILGWIDRTFGRIAFIFTFLLILFSPWIHFFAGARGSLWWCIWSVYIPFLCMLFLLEKKNRGIDITNFKIYLWLFIAVFIKCFFSGLEYITVSLVALYCPVVFYAFLEKMSFKNLLSFSFKLGVVAIVSLLLYLLILIIQMKFYYGSFEQAFDYFLYSYTRRTSLNHIPDQSIVAQLYSITVGYMQGYVFNWGFVDVTDSPFHFMFLWAGIIISGIVIFVWRKRIDRKYMGLVIMTAFSLLCPFSWFFIFRNHAINHYHMNYILWYIPSLILGFAVVGSVLALTYDKFLKPKLVSK